MSIIFKGQGQNSAELLRCAIKAKLATLEKEARSGLVVGNIVNGNLGKIVLLGHALKHATCEDDLFEVARKVAALEKDMLEKKPAQIARINNCMRRSGKRQLFFDYMLEQEVPSAFIDMAMDFRNEISGFGWSLYVDNGLVLAQNASGEEINAGHLERVYLPHAAVSSEIPDWRMNGLRSKALGRTGKWSNKAVSCSIKFQNEQLGFHGSSARSFVYAKSGSLEYASKRLYEHLEAIFRFSGFSLELNEDGQRLHLYFLAKGKQVVAHMFGNRLYEPRETWQKRYHA